MSTFVLVAQIILSILLVVLVVLQTQSSGAGSMFGTDTSVYRTRRGLEKTLYQATIGVSIVFIIVSILSVLITG